MVYLWVLVFLIIGAALFDRKVDKRLSALFYFLEFLVLILLMTLRFRVGGDGLYYENGFPYLPNLSELASFNIFEQLYQPFWYVLNAIIKSIYDDFTFFQFVHAIIVNTAIFYLIPKYTDKKFLGILVYYIFFYLYFNTEILREVLAIIFFLFAYPLIFKKKYVQYYLLCFCAYMFHAFAMFTFIVPLLVYFFRKPIKLYHTLIITVIVILAPTLILNGLLKIFSFNDYIARQLKYYTELEININGILKNLFDAIPIFIIIMMQQKKKRIDPILVPAVNIYFILVLLSVTLAGATRLSNYFMFFFFMAVINTFLSNWQEKLPYYRTQLAVILFFLFISKAFYYMRDMTKYNYGYPARFYNIYIPYHSVFDPEKERTRENIFNNSMEENVVK